MRSRDTITAALALPTYYGYYVFADSLLRGWVYYVCSAVLMAWLAWCYVPSWWVGRFAVVLILLESSQQAVCGSITGALRPDGQDLCVGLVGETPYRIGLSLVLAAIITGALWQSRPQPR